MASSLTCSICLGRAVARGLGDEREAEQRLDDGVVQVAREPVALLDDGELAAALEERRVLDRDRRVRGEELDQVLVGFVEPVRRPACR